MAASPAHQRGLSILISCDKSLLELYHGTRLIHEVDGLMNKKSSQSFLRFGCRNMPKYSHRKVVNKHKAQHLVGQKAVGDVALREVDGGLDGLRSELDAVVCLVLEAKAPR